MNVVLHADVRYLNLLRLGDKLAILKLLQDACGFLCQVISELLNFRLEIGKVLLDCLLFYGLCVWGIKCLKKTFFFKRFKRKPHKNGDFKKKKLLIWNLYVMCVSLVLTRVCNQHKQQGGNSQVQFHIGVFFLLQNDSTIPLIKPQIWLKSETCLRKKTLLLL